MFFIESHEKNKFCQPKKKQSGGLVFTSTQQFSASEVFLAWSYGWMKNVRQIQLSINIFIIYINIYIYIYIYIYIFLFLSMYNDDKLVVQFICWHHVGWKCEIWTQMEGMVTLRRPEPIFFDFWTLLKNMVWPKLGPDFEKKGLRYRDIDF